MCFYIHDDHLESKIAKKDIVCYKVVAGGRILEIEEISMNS